MANLKQKRARIYTDFDLAFGNNAITGDINKKLDVNAVKQSLKTLVLTKPYERPFNPLLGSEIYGLLFEPMTPFTTAAIDKSLQYLIQNYEKRARLQSIDIEPLYDLNTYNVTISFFIVGINQPQKLEIKLERLR